MGFQELVPNNLSPLSQHPLTIRVVEDAHAGQNNFTQAICLFREL
jgi:hypothetical protein